MIDNVRDELTSKADTAREELAALISLIRMAVFAAVVGAIYVELGLETARRWLLDLAAPELAAEPSLVALKSPKSRLQEAAYSRTGRAPTYRVVSAVGPDHAKHFVVEAMVGGEVLGVGEGSNRRAAEQQAATTALGRLTPDDAASAEAS